MKDPDIYDLLMTSPPSYSPASPVGAAEAWKRRARFRRRVAALLGILAVVLFVALLGTLTLPASGPNPVCTGATCSPSPSPSPPPQADPWVAVSALGTAAAGIGAVISGIAAILALRAAAAAQNITPAPAKGQKATFAAKKPPAKRKTKR